MNIDRYECEPGTDANAIDPAEYFYPFNVTRVVNPQRPGRTEKTMQSMVPQRDHTENVDQSGLIQALHRLVERSNIPGLLQCNFRSSRIREETLTPEVQQDLLRIAQEAISNAIRHARPTVISVTLRCTPPNLVLRITDNGSGFDKGRKMKGARRVRLLPTCRHGQKILAPISRSEPESVAVPVSLSEYR
jgi:hypothetical protein